MAGIVRTGMILKGRYCILEQVGSGGEGSVFLARDLELGSVWAVKELPLADKREAKLMRLLEHPVLPRMVDYVERGEFCYLVMEYIRGQSLRECLQKQKVFSLEQVLSFGIVIAGALEYLHNQNPPVFYGDLKPENLMLSEHGKLYLVDLGSAVNMYGDGNALVKGTYGYAAPEQYDGQVKKSGDVYALGKTLWELMGRKRLLYFMKHPAVLMFLLRCCQKRPDWRYAEMKAVKEALRKLRIAGRSAKARMVFPILLTGIILAVLVYRSAKTPPFLTALDKVTREYYGTDFYLSEHAEESSDGGFVCAEAPGQLSERHELCTHVERQLQRLLKTYSDTEEQERLLLLLARNAELDGNQEHASLYYEQLLLYEPDFGQGYGEYGCFLFRIGQQEESMKLRGTYEKREEEGTLEEDLSGKTGHWKKMIDEYKSVQDYEKISAVIGGDEGSDRKK